MSEKQLSVKLAHLLSSLYDLSQRESFKKYVSDCFEETIHHLPHFRCLFIAEAEDGDLKTGPKLGQMRHWWQRDDGGLHDLLGATPSIDTNFSDYSPFFPTALLLFYYEGDVLVTFEHIGHLLRCYKRFNIVIDGETLRLGKMELLNL